MIKRERERERKREKRERMRNRGGGREREREMKNMDALFLFLTGVTGALVSFSHLVLKIYLNAERIIPLVIASHSKRTSSGKCQLQFRTIH